MPSLKLTKPIMVDGTEKKELTYNLDDLTGEDIQRVTSELMKKGVPVSTIELDPVFHAALFACSAGLAIEDLNRFSAKDYTAASKVVRDFFLEDTAE